jgi:branched-subunit amino acid ABC-type transport system permease component
MAPVYAIFPDMGVSMLMIVLLVIIVGGLESLNGAVITGLAVGLLLSFGYQFIGVYNEIVVFLIVAAFLLFRPWGLFGHPHEAGW